MEPSNTLKKIRMARTFCAEHLPWFAPMLYACRIRLSREVAVAAIAEDLRTFFNPRAVEELWSATDPTTALRQLGFIWAHEIAHVLRDHGQRARSINAEPKLWNLAADLEINDANWHGLEAPDIFPPCLPRQYFLPEGRLAEQYYSALKKAGQDLPQERLPQDEGSAIHGQSRAWEEQDEQQEIKGAPTSNLNSPNPIHELDLEIIRKQTEQLLKEAEQKGQLPAALSRWVQQGRRSVVDWRKVLARRIRQQHTTWEMGRQDYSLRHPHRRQSTQAPFVMPALAGQPKPMHITCVVDTSGSINEHTLTQILAEVEKIMDTLNCEALVVPCDARAYTPIPLKRKADLRKIGYLQGGGGTNMIAGVEAALALKPTPAMVIVFTDGYTPYPPQRYATPVIWALVESDFGRAPGPPEEVWPREWVVRVRRVS